MAKSGSDYVTMENYATGQSLETSSAGDPLFHFKMYGTRVNNQTWHQKQVDSGAFQGAILSFAIE